MEGMASLDSPAFLTVNTWYLEWEDCLLVALFFGEEWRKDKYIAVCVWGDFQADLATGPILPLTSPCT